MNGVTSENKQQPFPITKKFWAELLGPARGVGNDLAQWILKANGRVVPRRSLGLLKVDQLRVIPRRSLGLLKVD